MISEIIFARKFNTFWNEILPGSRNFVKLLNRSLVKTTNESLPPDDDPLRRALINRAAFATMRHIINNKIDSSKVNKIFADNYEQILIQEFGSKKSLHIDQNEVGFVTTMAERLIDRYYYTYDTINIDPPFPGCGFIQGGQGDILVDDTLVEIKAGDRNFSIIDIRQLLIYGSLNHVSAKPYYISNFELYNPRTGYVWKENINELCKYLTGGSAQEIFSDIIYFICNTSLTD